MFASSNLMVALDGYAGMQVWVWCGGGWCIGCGGGGGATGSLGSFSIIHLPIIVGIEIRMNSILLLFVTTFLTSYRSKI